MRGFHVLALAVTASLLGVAPTLAAKDDAAAVNPKDKMVCKRTQRTGTRFQEKMCKTVGQWDAIAEEHRRNLNETVDRPQIEIRRE